ncbi:PREDICTED: pathogenesis-related protein PR-1-like [Camelina sativa]|uniref:Pathogenesis-related protein PR-1-like n=1 Tax=Camelina sativa TaxID=90675 RepID=A0ABM0UZ00_CAMSA|nr:PREDICTED: pathogenesis-related protein PR-1-like [Camelina sativa]
MATTTSTQTILFAVAIFLVAIQAVHADYYRPRLPTVPSPPSYVAKPKPLPTPSPKPILYHPPPTYQPPTGSFEQQFLDPHNTVRSGLGLPPLVWDEKIASYAAWWANQRRYDCSMTHSTGPYGENLFWGSGSDFTPTFAVESWTVEAQSYNHMTNSCEGSGMCGHYTQIVWRETRLLGCARVVCENGAGVFITCNYDPPGNYVGEKPY